MNAMQYIYDNLNPYESPYYFPEEEEEDPEEFEFDEDDEDDIN